MLSVIFYCVQPNKMMYTIKAKEVNIPSNGNHDFLFRMSHSKPGDTMICITSRVNDSLVLWNLKNLTFLKTIIYSKEGPNGIAGQILKTYFHNVDSIFVLTYDYLYIISQYGTIVNKYLFDLEKYGSKGYRPHYNFLDIQNCLYSSRKKLFYFSITTLASKTEELYDTPLFVALDLLSGDINVDYPSIPVDIRDSYYPPFAESVIYFMQNKIIYSFVGVPDIWEYNLDSKVINHFEIQNLKRTPSNKQFGFSNSEKSLEFANAGINYFNLIPNASGEYFLRFVIDNSQKKLSGDPKISILILNNKYELLAQKEYPKDMLAPFILPYEEGFLIKSKKNLTENAANYLFLSILKTTE